MMDPERSPTSRWWPAPAAVAGDGEGFVEVYRDDDRRPADVFGAIATDFVFRIPAVRLAEAQLEHTPNVWMYLFELEVPRLRRCPRGVPRHGGAVRLPHRR